MGKCKLMRLASFPLSATIRDVKIKEAEKWKY